MSDTEKLDPRSRFIELFMTHEKQIYRYILSLMPHSQDAQDVLQETAIALYNKIGDYDPTRPFAPWAFRFAYHMTLKHREKSGRWHRFLDEDLMKEIASRQSMLVPELDQRREYLKECLAEVPQDKRAMLTDYYFEDETVDAIADSQGKSVEATYKALQRVRKTLMHCIQGKMQASGMSAS